MRRYSALFLLLAACAPARADLEILNVKPVYGRLGPERADLKIQPFDQVYFRYDIAGLKVDAEGEVEIATQVSLTDPAGKANMGEAVSVKVPLAFGGDVMPSFATVFLPPDQKPGKYVYKVTVTDVAAKKSASFTRELELQPLTFAGTSLNFSFDGAGEISAPAGGPAGQPLYVRFLIIGFDKSRARIEVEVQSRILDAAGKPTHAKPMLNRIATDKLDEVRGAQTLTVVNSLMLHRPGKYRLEILLTDKVSKKTHTLAVPLTVTGTD